MADFYEIKSKKSDFLIRIDGLDILFTPLGAGSDLTFSQKQRRSEFLLKKISTLQESAKTMEDFDSIEKSMAEYEKLDTEVQGTVRKMFKGAKGFEVQADKWLAERSIFELLTYIEEIGDQMKAKENSDAGTEKTTV